MKLLLSPASRDGVDITGKPMRGWAMIELAGWRDVARLRRWVAWAVEFTGSLPAK